MTVARASASVREWRGAAAVVLRAGDAAAVVLPSLGMLIASLTRHGGELVALPGGLRAWRAGHTTGIPLLYPWANRLARRRYRVGARTVDLRDIDLHTDGNGLPIHGTMIARPEWDVTALGAGERTARVAARFDFGAHDDLLASFPFPHELSVAVTLSASGLRVATAVRPTGRTPVPVAFGWHPYFQLPERPRDDWEVALPARAHARLDRRGVPTGRARTEPAERVPLRGHELDDLYALGPDRVLALHAGAHRVRVTFDDHYPYAQVYAPAGKRFCALEPMTAPTNALVTGDHPTVRPGATFVARFTIAV
jgi:galactose mutarotase-like enzyme